MPSVVTKPLISRLRRLFAPFAVVAIVAASGLLGAPAEATPNSQPVANWGTIYASPTVPWGGMFWDGSHLWAPTTSTMTELAPNDNGSSPVQTIAFNGFQASYYLGSTVVELGGHIFATGFAIAGGIEHPGIVEIDPTSGQQVRAVDFLTLNGTVNTPMPGGFVSGSSIVFLDASGKMWRFVPSTSTLSPIGGLSSPEARSIQLVGSTLWLGFSNGSLAAYDFSSSTTTLGAPRFSIAAQQNASSVAALTSDGQHLWAAEGNQMIEVDLTSGQQVGGPISLGSVTPTSIASDGTWVWYVNPSGTPGALYGFSVNNPTQIISMPGPAPTVNYGLNGVYFDGSDLWVVESQDQTIEQLKLLPSKPTITNVSATSHSSVSLTFTPPTNPGNQPIADSELLVSPVGPGIRATPVNPSGTTISGLSPGTRYCFSIRASNGPYSSTSAPSCITLAASSTTTTTTRPSGLPATGAPLSPSVMLGVGSLGLGVFVLRWTRRKLASNGKP